MLFCNNKLIDTANTNDSAVKFFLEKKKIIENRKGLVVIRQHREDSTAKVYYDTKGRRLRSVPVSIPCHFPINRPGAGTEIWRYAESAMPTATPGKINYTPSSWIVGDQIEFSPSEHVEQVFYLLFILGSDGLKSCSVYEENLVDKAKKKSEMYGGDELDVRYQIFRNKEIADESLRQIALAWNITNAYILDIEILKNTLFERVMEAHKKNPQDNQAMKAFLKDCKLGEVTELKAMVNKAVFEGKIFNFDRNTRRWLYASGGDYICQVPPDKIEEKNQYLVEYFLKPERFPELEALRQEVWSDHIKPSYSLTDLDKFNDVKEFRKVAKDLGKALPFNISKPESAKKWVIENCGIV
jgi:hypothetical protein